MKKYNVLMVCLGNICRSPIAEGLLQHKVNQLNLDVHADSCGTGGWHAGELPDPRSIGKMDEYGIDIRYQHSRKIKGSDFEEFDIIYCMDSSNLSDVRSIAKGKEQLDKIELILNEKTFGKEEEVPDPYYGAGDGFEFVYRQLDVATDAIIEQLKKS